MKNLEDLKQDALEHIQRNDTNFIVRLRCIEDEIAKSMVANKNTAEWPLMGERGDALVSVLKSKGYNAHIKWTFFTGK
jgi:hypothetical protein